ncbi:DUF389 domain-containing protein [Streptomyces gossypiisoli]|uniref:hypothetical protein n=1 Tax=Streptomyces gossypiisoli TaxID=2748864 RepID=UPI0038CD13C1
MTCDVAREAGDELLSGLQELGIEDCGSIAVEKLDLSLSKRAEKAEKETPGEAADAVLWEHLTDATHEESTLSITYLAFITPTTMIAACGVVLDNAILIVGAMAVALHEGGACRPVHRGPVGGRPATDRVPGQTVGFIEQLLLNLLGILLAGTLTLLTQKWLWSTRRRRRSNAG